MQEAILLKGYQQSDVDSRRTITKQHKLEKTFFKKKIICFFITALGIIYWQKEKKKRGQQKVLRSRYRYHLETGLLQ